MNTKISVPEKWQVVFWICVLLFGNGSAKSAKN